MGHDYGANRLGRRGFETDTRQGDGRSKSLPRMDKEPLEEDYIVNPKNKGVKNVFVWLRPTGADRKTPFPQAAIHPTLLKPENPTVEIDQPCCRFIPHVLAARAGQTMIIKNSAPIAHNAHWNSAENGEINPLLPAGAKLNLKSPLSRSRERLACHVQFTAG